MPKSPLAKGLLENAEYLFSASNNKPKQADLRRAISACYYALFHTLCFNCANCIVGRGADYPKNAWRRSYRALQHGFAKGACNPKDKKKILAKFPDEIQDFSLQFYNFQIKRHLADYDPYFKVKKSSVESYIQTARQVIDDFEAAPLKDRRAFSTLVLFEDRKQ
jgi:uncharacterized protein (UPF0332 family)